MLASRWHQRCREIMGFGTARSQLEYEPTSGGSRGKWVNVAYWPDAADLDVRSNVCCRGAKRTRSTRFVLFRILTGSGAEASFIFALGTCGICYFPFLNAGHN